jgi:hypothetical protein
MKIIALIALILAASYILLTLYFEWRLDKQNKVWQERQKHTQNLKKN